MTTQHSSFILALLVLTFVALIGVVSSAPLNPHANAALCLGCAAIGNNNDESSSGCSPGQALTFPVGKCVNANGTTGQGQHFGSFTVNKPEADASGYELFFFPDGGCGSGRDVDLTFARCPAGSCCAVGGELVVDGVAYGAFQVGPEASPSPVKGDGGRGDADSDHFPWWATMASVIGGLCVLLGIAALIGVFMYLRKRKQYHTLY